ncbi:hypothetical protein C0993_002209 [Termitomyces sp. T159_Od127]|nr:hypothetical protein C0993_002209 [Termitomyces sp. T159_Od127]
MVAYLLTVGYDSPRIGTIRTLSVLFEMSATWIAPKVMAKIGPLRAAMWFVNWQIVCLVIGTSLFWHATKPVVGALFLICAVVASRVGLWGFDLSVQIIIQEASEVIRTRPCEMWMDFVSVKSVKEKSATRA